MKYNFLILFLSLFVIVACTSKVVVPSEKGEGETAMTCFDYLDNDNDNKYDLNDEDCFAFAEDDWDNDGYINVVEFEQGTDLTNRFSHP